MKIILACIAVTLFTELRAEDHWVAPKWGSEITPPSIKKEKISDFMARGSKYKEKNYLLEAKFLCSYFKQNSFVDMVDNKSSRWPHDKPKNAHENYLKASQKVDKAVESECNKKEPFHGNILNSVWNTFFESCDVKDKECWDFALKYVDRADVADQAAIETINFIANQKNEGSVQNRDCGAGVANSHHSKEKDQDKTDAIPSSGALQK